MWFALMVIDAFNDCNEHCFFVKHFTQRHCVLIGTSLSVGLETQSGTKTSTYVLSKMDNMYIIPGWLMLM